MSTHGRPYPAPLVIPPLETNHTHTLILLHGRGSNAERFGRELLKASSLAAQLPTVRFVFPTASKRRSTVLKKIPINQWFDNYSLEDPGQRTELQVEGLCQTGVFLRGLIDSEARLLGEDGHRKIIIGGLSQGCAAAIFTFLGGMFGADRDVRLGGFVGMSGWLPLEHQLRDILLFEPCSGEDDDDILFTIDSTGNEKTRLREPDANNLGLDELGSFRSMAEVDDGEKNAAGSRIEDDDDDNDEDDQKGQTSSSDDDSYSTSNNRDEETLAQSTDANDSCIDANRDAQALQALNHVRDILDLPLLGENCPNQPEGKPSKPSGGMSVSAKEPLTNYLRSPAFVGHGSADPKVSVRLGESMSDFLATALHMDVTWKAYEGLGHWYSVTDEIDDIVSFLKKNVEVPVCERPR